MASTLTVLEQNILRAKGMTEPQVKALIEAGVTARADFRTVKDAGTLCALVEGLSAEVAKAVMDWAMDEATPAAGGGGVVVDSADVVYCVHCQAKQPKDYKSGDLCGSCGKQAEPILTCFWCAASGPGRFCRACGAQFISTAELELGVLLKREGLAKDDIPARLEAMSAADKEVLWGRVRKSRR
ncbi:MAG: hypothetical protein H6730_26105 [Deltaproteobacteria bacterium]|nr:hypothetical protein [Deltaproteobacteria bacterium]